MESTSNAATTSGIAMDEDKKLPPSLLEVQQNRLREAEISSGITRCVYIASIAAGKDNEQVGPFHEKLFQELGLGSDVLDVCGLMLVQSQTICNVIEGPAATVIAILNGLKV